ncbi:MAG: hypothetical protein RL497_672 [Pseudomonadota bacterium]|jgi:hypothetical protein
MLNSLLGEQGGSFVYTRRSEQTYLDDTGVWQLNASENNPSFSSLGILIEPKRTNYLNVFSDIYVGSLNGLTTSENIGLKIVSDENGLEASGLSNLTHGHVYEVSNQSAEIGYLKLDRTHSKPGSVAISVFVNTQSAGIKFYLSGRKGLVDVPNTNIAKPYSRVMSENISSSGEEYFEIEMPPNSVMRFILPQLEQGNDSSAAGVTSPIINHGAPKTRDLTRLVLKYNVSTTDKFAVGLSITPTTNNQDNAAAYYFDLYKNSSNRLRLFGSAVVNAISETTNGYGFGKYFPQLNQTSRLIVYSGEEVLAVADGALPNTSIPSASNLDLSQADLYIGSKQDASQVFTGWVKNVSFYAGELNKEQLLDLTAPQDMPEPIGVTGAPLYDRINPAKIYTLSSWTSSGFTQISVSEDGGVTFRESIKLCTPTRMSALQQDNEGNFYYSTELGLNRVERLTGACKNVINWNGYLPASASKSWSWNTWHWAVSNEGWLYTTAYTLTGLGGQMIYVSKDFGQTWSLITSLIDKLPLNRHIHSLMVNPKDNKLYLSIGDDAEQRGNYVSTETLTAWNEKNFIMLSVGPYAKGATGITYTDDWVYWSSDTVGSTNYIVQTSSDPASEEAVITFPNNFHITPVYFLLSQGNHRLVSVSYNEKATKNASGAVMIWQKATSQYSQWKLKRLYAQYDYNSANYSFYALGHNGRGKIPEGAAYIFVTTLRTDNKLPGETFRIKVQ